MMGVGSTQIARFGRFEVVSRIGVGGMGEVFRARMRGGGGVVDVALKLIRPESATDDRVRKMFVAEARIGALLDHPNLVRLIDFGEVGGALYLAMELVDGVALDRLLKRGPLPAPLAAHVARAVLGGLGYAHALRSADGRPLGLVHRDVSPTNILLSQGGAVKLTDFGVVKVTGVSLTMKHEIKGKRAYMAPEQLEAGSVDGRVDLFAVGVLLHHLVRGHGPFHDVGDWLRGGARVAEGGPLAAVIKTALAIDPAARYQTAEAFVSALAPAVGPIERAETELAQRVKAAMKTERPLASIDQLLISDFADPTSSLGHTPSPSGREPTAAARALENTPSVGHSLWTDEPSILAPLVPRPLPMGDSDTTKTALPTELTPALTTEVRPALPTELTPALPTELTPTRRFEASHLISEEHASTKPHPLRSASTDPAPARSSSFAAELTTSPFFGKAAAMLAPTPTAMAAAPAIARASRDDEEQTHAGPRLAQPVPAPSVLQPQPSPSGARRLALGLSVVAALALAFAVRTLRTPREAPTESPARPVVGSTAPSPRQRPSAPMVTKALEAPAPGAARRTDATKAETTAPAANGALAENAALEASRAAGSTLEASDRDEAEPEADAPRREPRRSRSKPPSTPGYLTLDTEPWSIAYLGARRLGATPFARLALPPGRYALSLDVEESGRRKPLMVKIAAGAETRIAARLR